jgi:DegV family protein with EDD domain
LSKIAIVTDSCASIPETLIESLRIHWVPYYIHRGTEVLRDLVSVQREEFYRWLPLASELPKTASPGPGDYLSMYERLRGDEGVDQIISIHMTSKGSGAYQAARAAQEMIHETIPSLHIEVVDTLNVSMCHGWMVIEAARMALQNADVEEIMERIKSMIPVTQMLQTADTLKYLYMGGRIGRAKHLVATLLNIKPIIGMEEGVIVALGTARSRRKAYEMIVNKIEAAVGRMGRINIAYVHAAAAEEALNLKAMVSERLSVVEELFAELSPALGVHSGPGTVGVCFYPADL